MRMVKVKTADLIGSALDWAVAKAEGDEHWTSDRNIDWFAWRMRNWKPSTYWSQGGPLIEKHKVWLGAPIKERTDWTASVDESTEVSCSGTPLIAACRAIVAAKIGDVVSVPAELLKDS